MKGLQRLWLVFSMSAMSVARAADPVGHVQVANVDEHVNDVRVNVEDKKTVNVVIVFSRSDPDNTVRILPIDGDLSLRAKAITTKGGQYLIITDLMSSKSPKPRFSLGVPGDQAQTTAFNFSICGDRTIMIYGGMSTGRCADLPPMAKPDPHSDQCSDCDGPYEGMPPSVTESRTRIAPLSEPGEPLTISGRVLGSDGHPRAGIIVYAYHTNRLGIYPRPVLARSYYSQSHGQLRGWARTDAAGRYTFETIRPGSYPHSHNPQHVHMHIIDPGCASYRIKELQFSDDPMRKQFTEEDRQHQEDAAIETPRKTAKGWEVTHDIKLGEVDGYKSCPPPK